MIAKDLVTDSLPVLKPTDTGQTALELMESYRVSHLPLVDQDQYITLVSENDIFIKELEQVPLAKAKLSTFRPFVTEKQSIFDVLTLLSKIKVSVLPVLSTDQKYIGSILVPELIYSVVKILGLDQEGAVITLKMKKRDYSITQIGQIIEANNLKILSLFTTSIDSDNLRVIIKLNSRDIISLIQTFERYDFEVESILYDDQKYKQLYKERLQALMNYLSI